MSGKKASCPNCGGEITFRSSGSLLVVCEFCNCSCYRKDVDLEKIGEMSERAALPSNFQIGTCGTWGGEPFEVKGQLQLDHGAGLWNEWCAETASGDWIWIAESQGEVWVLHEVDSVGLAPPGGDGRDATRLGTDVVLDGGRPFEIHELGKGQVVTAGGELPIRISAGVETTYANLCRGFDEIATVDWTREGTPEVLLGQRVHLDELALERDTQPETTPREVKATRFNCTNCQAPVAVRDPVGTKGIGCESCGAVFARDHHGVKAVQAQAKVRAKSRIPLGAKGELQGETVEVLGVLEKFVTYAGKKYPWRETLLRNEDGAYRWLIENKGHWAMAWPVAASATSRNRRRAIYEGRTLRHFSRGDAEVAWVMGELYWDVKRGDVVRSDDYVGPGEMVSAEETEKEVNVTHAVHVDRREVQRAFGLDRPLPTPRGVGMAQPNPCRPKVTWSLAGGAIALLLVLRVLIGMNHEQRVVVDQWFGPIGASADQQVVEFSEPFEITAARGNLRIDLEVPNLNQGWVGIGGALVNETSGDVTTFGVDAQYYSGYDDGNWSEGNRRGSTILGTVPPGTYRMRLDPLGYQNGFGQKYRLTARSQVPRMLFFFLAAFALLIFPVVITLRWFYFEKTRWYDSDHNWPNG